MSSRPKLTPLSALMPQKGTATRPEYVSERASEQADDRVSDQAFGELTGKLTGEWHSERESGRASERASKAPDLEDPAEYIDGPRSSVSFRMTERLKDRLREYAHFSRRQKQDIMDQAVHEFLKRQGY
jgi:hypothetical protein